jgi:hypothetical protein
MVFGLKGGAEESNTKPSKLRLFGGGAGRFEVGSRAISYEGGRSVVDGAEGAGRSVLTEEEEGSATGGEVNE